MAIITYDQLIAAIAGAQKPVLYKIGGTTLTNGAGFISDMSQRGGFPAPLVTPTAGLNGEQVTSATVGAIPFTNAGGTAQKYLAGVQWAGSVVGTILLYDRLWQNSGINVTTTTLQSFSAPVALPARDQNGTNVGIGVDVYLEVYTATTNAGAISNATVTYTNSSGTGGRTGTLQTIPANAYAGTMIQMNLQAGDVGVQKVDGITLNTSLVTGAVGLVIVRRIATLNTTVAYVGDTAGWERVAEKLWAGSALNIMVLNANTNLPWVWMTPIFVEG